MGAWGAGIFENDDAGDWLWEYEERGVAAVTEAFDRATAGGYVEVDAGAAALAAAEVVAAAHDATSSAVGPEERRTLMMHADAVRAADLKPRARAAVEAVTGADAPSELKQLWAESEVAPADAAAFISAVEDLKTRLQ